MNNCCHDNYDPSSKQINKFRDFAKSIEEFKPILLYPSGRGSQNSFYYAVLFGIYYQLKNKKEECRTLYDFQCG